MNSVSNTGVNKLVNIQNLDNSKFCNRQFHLLFNKDYSSKRSSQVEKTVFNLFAAVQFETLGKVQKVVERLQNQSCLNTCAALGRARLLAQQFENEAADPAESKKFLEKKDFLLKTLKAVLREGKKDEKTFFRDLYSGRLKWHIGKPLSRTTFNLGKAARLLAVIGTVILASHAVVASNEVNGRSPSTVVPALAFKGSSFYLPQHVCLDFINEVDIDDRVKNLGRNLDLWNEELHSQQVDRTLKSYMHVLEQMPRHLPGKHIAKRCGKILWRNRIYRQLSTVQMRLDRTFLKFKTVAFEQIAQFSKEWLPVRGRLVKKLANENGEVVAEDFIDGVAYLDNLAVVHNDYSESLVALKLQNRRFNRDVRMFSNNRLPRVWQKFIRSTSHHLEVIHKLAYDTYQPHSALEPLRSMAAKEWMARAINCSPSDSSCFNDVQLVRLLHFAGYPKDEFLKDGHTAMTLAASVGRAGITEALLKLGIWPNHKNDLGEPPLFLAVFNQHYNVARILGAGRAGSNPSYFTHPEVNGDTRAVKVLRKFGFDPNEMFDGENALHWAAKFAHDHSIEVFLRMGADANTLDHFENSTALCLYKNLHVNKRPPASLVKYDEICEEISAAKLLGHALEFDGSIAINGNEIPLMHGFPGVMLKHMMVIFDKFTNSYQGEFKADEIKAVRQFLRSGYSFKGNNFFKLLDDIKNGKLAVIPTGFFFDENNSKGHHAIMVFFYDRKLVIANKGFGSRMPVEVYEIDPAIITVEALRGIADLVNQEYQDYLIWLSNLQTTFGAKAVKQVNVPLPWGLVQKVGNCAWESNETGFYAFISLLRKDKSAIRSFRRIEKYIQFFVIKNFFKKVSASTILKNPVLLKMILDKVKTISWPPKFKKQLDKHLNTYALMHKNS